MRLVNSLWVYIKELCILQITCTSKTDKTEDKMWSCLWLKGAQNQGVNIMPLHLSQCYYNSYIVGSILHYIGYCVKRDFLTSLLKTSTSNRT